MKSMKCCLRQLRTELGLSRVELAELSGVSAYTIGELERESRGPSLDVAMRLASALNVPVEDMFSVTRDGATSTRSS